MNRLCNVISTALFLLPMAASASPVSTSSRMLPTGQILTPAGRQTPLSGTLPLNMVRLNGGRYAVINCSGGLQGLSVIDLVSGKETQFVPEQKPWMGLNDTPGYIATGSSYYGIALSPDGKQLYASEGGLDAVGSYIVTSDNKLVFQGDIHIPSDDSKVKNFIGGLAVSPDGSELYAVCTHTDRLAIYSLSTSPAPAATNSMPVPRYVPVGAFPLALAVNPKSGALYVTSYTDGAITIVDPSSEKTLTVATGAAPDALLVTPDGSHLWVANGDSDTISCIEASTNKIVSSTLVRPDSSRGLPAGGPEGLALSPDGRTLYVADADLNAVASLHVSTDGGHASLTGFAPAGWYPTTLSVSDDGKTLFTVNAKGSMPLHPDPDGPSTMGKGNNRNLILTQLKGSVSSIPVAIFKNPNTGLYPVLADNQLSSVVRPDQAAAAALLKSLPIEHVIYIIKENRTYDQVLGDIKPGNGDPSLTIFGEGVTPNEHAISEQFSLIDNFSCCAEVSADGWNWSSSGYASPYVERTVPEYYREGESRWAHSKNPESIVVGGSDYDYEGENRSKSPSLAGEDDVAESPGGYIWDLVAKKKLSYMNFGCFLSFAAHSPSKPALVDHTDPDFSPFDLDYSDSDAYIKLGADPPKKTSYGPDAEPSRFSAWKRDFDQRVAAKNLPAFEIVRLPRDHTSGTTPGKDSPLTMAADNDYAVGELVDAVSHSPYWKDTAIFIVEDDAQDGPDHVDCHRSTAYVVSAYTRRKYVDNHFYNTDSILHTMEVLLSVSPMTRFDKTAPLLQLFTTHPDFGTYTAILPQKSIFQKNQKTAYGAGLSKKMNFAVADDVDDDVLNQVLWHAIKGNVPYPGVHNLLR